MTDTKENILQTALRLFAQDGYEAVSVSMISVELGMTKGALYKHYKNKRDIFDSIIQRLYEADNERSKEYQVPEKEFDKEPLSYSNITIKNIKNFTEAQFRFWMEDEFSVNIRRMLSLERYRNSEMGELYQNVFVRGPINYIKDMFLEMMKQGVLKKSNSTQLATEFYAPFYLLLSLSDVSSDKTEIAKLLAAHVDKFIKDYFEGEKNNRNIRRKNNGKQSINDGRSYY